MISYYLWNVFFNDLDYSFHVCLSVQDYFNILGNQVCHSEKEMGMVNGLHINSAFQAPSEYHKAPLVKTFPHSECSSNAVKLQETIYSC